MEPDHERTPSMYQEITPIPVRPWTLNGLSERLIVSHYENNYGAAVRTFNAVRSELAALDEGAPGYRIRAVKREELMAMGSVTLHELYFANLGGEGNGFHVGCSVIKALRERGFDARYIRGGVSAWYAAGGARAMQPASGKGGRS